MTDKSEFFDALASLADYQDHVERQIDADARTWWSQLNQENRMKAFYIVTRMIYESEFIENRSYRGMLYEKFDFPPESYQLGMLAGLLHLHNRMLTDDEYHEYRNLSRRTE